MKKKNLVMVLLSMLIIISLVSMAQAVTLITFPSGGGRLNNETATVEMETTGAMSECRLTVHDAGRTGYGLTNTTNKIIGTNITNTSATQTNFTFTINSFAIEDGNNYNVSVECTNSTVSGNPLNLTETSSVSDVFIDNTFPTVATALTSSVTSNNPTLTATATDSNTRQCRIDWSDRSPISGNDPVYALASGTCSFALTNAVDGTFGYKVITSDGNNETSSSEVYLKIDSQRDENRPPALQEGVKAEGASVGEAAGGAMGIIASFFSKLGAMLKSWFS